MVADALSRKTCHSVNAVTMLRREILRHLENMGIEIMLPQEPGSSLGSMLVQLNKHKWEMKT